jgi:hypothetical protein
MLPDSYIEAGIDAPAAEPLHDDPWRPEESGTRLNLEAENVKSVVWATGYGLEFSFLDILVLDKWKYPRHSRGVTEVAGLYAVGLPWLIRHASATLALVGEAARYVAEHTAGRNWRDSIALCGMRKVGYRMSVMPPPHGTTGSQIVPRTVPRSPRSVRNGFKMRWLATRAASKSTSARNWFGF